MNDFLVNFFRISVLSVFMFFLLVIGRLMVGVSMVFDCWIVFFEIVGFEFGGCFWIIIGVVIVFFKYVFDIE